ncbi:MAG: Rpn family recombination-promoting nuclease/putative transposase, partial [Lachnospiraceae bacterium]|nr:Rpn family recombination-promoting nuclease/putative transposase [Lachnospiraceae bacterium]
MKEKDMLEKVLEEYNDVYADILNALLFEGEERVKPEDLEDAQPFSLYYDGENLREQFRDIAKFWTDPKSDGQESVGIRMVMFGIENQTSYDKDMPIRVMSYDAAQYRRQLDSKERYPVATLIIYYGEKKWENRTLYENIQVPEDMQSFVSDYRINVYDLSNLTDEEIGRFQSDFGIIADYLKHSREDPGYIPTKKIEYKHPHETLDLLSRFTGDEKYRQIFRQERGEVIDMRSPLDYWLEKGRE